MEYVPKCIISSSLDSYFEVFKLGRTRLVATVGAGCRGEKNNTRKKMMIRYEIFRFSSLSYSTTTTTSFAMQGKRDFVSGWLL